MCVDSIMLEDVGNMLSLGLLGILICVCVIIIILDNLVDLHSGHSYWTLYQ